MKKNFSLPGHPRLKTHALNYSDTGNYVTYTIDLGAYFAQGTSFNYFVFVNDDGAEPNQDPCDGSNSYFKAVSVTPIPGALWLLRAGIFGLLGVWRFRVKKN